MLKRMTNTSVLTMSAQQASKEQIAGCYWQFPAGKAGMCSHAYAMMKTVAKWVIDRLKIIPEDMACTSKPYVWNVPQARRRASEYPPISELRLKSPDSKKKNQMRTYQHRHQHQKKEKG